jgi:hypothetical protein
MSHMSDFDLRTFMSDALKILCDDESLKMASSSSITSAMEQLVNDLKAKGLIAPDADPRTLQKKFDVKQFKLPENTSGLVKVSRESDGTLCLHTKASIFKINVGQDFKIRIEHKDNKKPYLNGISLRSPVEIVYK